MHADIIIIGGGIIGLSCAYRMSKDGMRVIVVERGQCGQEASWAGAGIISPCSWHRRDALARLHMASVFRYHTFAEELQETSGIDLEFRRCGELKPILDDNRLKMARNEVKAIDQRKTPEGDTIAQTLTPAQTRVVEPAIQKDLRAAQHVRLTARVRNPRLLAALLYCCRKQGVDVREGTAVRGLMKNKDSVLGVIAEDERIIGGKTLLCAGAWSSQPDSHLEQLIPVHPVRGQIILLHMNPLPIERIIYQGEAHFYLVPRDDGHVLVGSTEEHDSGFSKRNSAAALARLSSLALDYVPALARATWVKSWAGLRPGTPDRRPFMGPVPGMNNLFAATGHFRTGLTLAPEVADIMADFVHRGSCKYDLTKASPGRAKAIRKATADAGNPLTSGDTDANPASAAQDNP